MNKKKKIKKKTKRGFTLTELLAVILILAIIILIAIVGMNLIINKTKKNANEVNKATIEDAAETCLKEESEEDCDSVSKLQDNGYLGNFGDPWTGNTKNLDNSYTVVVKPNNEVKVVYHGEGIKQENKTPPNEYFSYCNTSKTCINGLTTKGKVWLQEHNDILIIPDNITEMKNCSTTSTDCTNFSGINIEAIIATRDITINSNFENANIGVIKLSGGTISGKFNNSNISLLQIDSGSITGSNFQTSKINKLILGNASQFEIGENSFNKSVIDYFRIESGTINWQAATSTTIGTLVIGENVTHLGGNAFNGAKINELVISSNKLNTTGNNNNQPFRSWNGCNDINAPKFNKITISSNVDNLPSKLIANNMNVRYVAVGDLIIKNKDKFDSKTLFNIGFNCSEIVNALKGSKNEIDLQTCKDQTNNGKSTTENCIVQ